MIYIKLELIKEEIKKGSIVIDVRTKREYDTQHIEGAINIKYDNILSGIKNYIDNKNRRIILYCSNGSRSKIAYNLLISFGYTNVVDMGKINL